MTDARIVRDELKAFIEADSTFSDFEKLSFPPRRQGLSPPSIVLTMETNPASQYGLGTLRIDIVTIGIDLMFREGWVNTIDGNTLTDEELAQDYLDKLLDRVKAFRPTAFTMDSFNVTGATHEEEMGQLYLFGCGVDVVIGYKV